jgi:hypothetical protein
LWRRASRSSRSSSERLIEIESDSKESVLNTVVMPLQYPTGVGEGMAVGFAALRQMPSLRRGGWLFAYDDLVVPLHSLTFHDFEKKFSSRGLDAFLAFKTFPSGVPNAGEAIVPPQDGFLLLEREKFHDSFAVELSAKEAA